MSTRDVNRITNVGDTCGCILADNLNKLLIVKRRNDRSLNIILSLQSRIVEDGIVASMVDC